MRQKSKWTARIDDGTGLLHVRLASAFATDIIEQIIEDGARLPPHRELAYQLKISVSTVTKAYAILEKQGLVRSEKGRATFAVGVKTAPGSHIDLSVNVPPRIVSDRLLSQTLSEVASTIDVSTFSSYAPTIGARSYRAALAGWISANRVAVDADDLILCNGAQHALAVAFGALCQVSNVVLTERFPYAGFEPLVRMTNAKLVGLPIDREGIVPEALERWLASNSQWSINPVLYVTPTAHNPTGCSMGRDRREQIVKVCRSYNVTIVEDDVYAVLGTRDVPTIREMAPERTLYVSGLSKTLTPGLRIGFLVCPDSINELANKVMVSIGAPVSPLSCLIMERWILNGTADHLLSRIRLEAMKRAAFAAGILNIKLPETSTFHAFLPLTSSQAAALSHQALERGVRTSKPSVSLPSNDDGHGAGLRLCLGSPTFDQLRTALQIVKDLHDDLQVKQGDRPKIKPSNENRTLYC